MNYTLDFPIQYIAKPGRFATIGLGELYIGVVDGDPAAEPADRVQAYIARQNDTDLAIPQPIELSAGGVPTYLGSPVTLKINQSFSVAVLSSHGSQIYYSPKSGEIIDEINNLSLQVASAVKYAATIADASALTELVAGKQISVAEYYSGTGVGGGMFVVKAGAATPNDVTIFASATAGAYLERINYSDIDLYMAGAPSDGVSNSCDPFIRAISSTKRIRIPEGTFVISPTALSGDYMLYLGTANGNTDRSGMLIYGAGNKSIIKLGDNVGAGKLLFGLASADVVSDMTFRDFLVDLNGQNNLQASFGAPLRYNSAWYMYGKCTNILWENITIRNVSGHQAIRVGAEDANKYGKNIRLINVNVENFGTAIPGNFQQDVSVCYIQADGIVVNGGSFANPDHTFDLTRGQTALELHGDSSTEVSGVRFEYLQLPILLVSSYKAARNFKVHSNTFTECNYLFSADGQEYDQRGIRVYDNEYTSTKVSSVICPLGNGAETAKTRENVVFRDNNVTTWGNTNQDVHLFSIEDSYVRSLSIIDNVIGGLNGCALYVAGTIRDSDTMTIVVSGNEMDSLGSSSGVFPNDPSFLFIAHSTGGINSLIVNENTLLNSASKNYSAVGAYRLTGRILNTYVNNTSGNVSLAYPLVTGSITGAVTKVIESNLEIPVRQRSDTLVLVGSSSLDLYDFAGYGNNDNAMIEVKLYANIGGTANGTVQSYDVLYSSNGRTVLKQTGAGTYNTDVILELSGTILRVRNSSVTTLTFNYVAAGDSTKSIVWLA